MLLPSSHEARHNVLIVECSSPFLYERLVGRLATLRGAILIRELLSDIFAELSLVHLNLLYLIESDSFKLQAVSFCRNKLVSALIELFTRGILQYVLGCTIFIIVVIIALSILLLWFN